MAEHRLPALRSPEALDNIDHLWNYYAHSAPIIERWWRITLRYPPYPPSTTSGCRAERSLFDQADR